MREPCLSILPSLPLCLPACTGARVRPTGFKGAAGSRAGAGSSDSIAGRKRGTVHLGRACRLSSRVSAGLSLRRLLPSERHAGAHTILGHYNPELKDPREVILLPLIP